MGPLLPPAWGGHWGSLGEELILQSCALLGLGWEQILGKAAAAHTEGWPSHFGSLKTLGGTEIPLCSLLLWGGMFASSLQSSRVLFSFKKEQQFIIV